MFYFSTTNTNIFIIMGLQLQTRDWHFKNILNVNHILISTSLVVSEGE